MKRWWGNMVKEFNLIDNEVSTHMKMAMKCGLNSQPCFFSSKVKKMITMVMRKSNG